MGHFSKLLRSPAYLIILLWFAGLTASAQFAKISLVFSQIQALYPENGVEIGLVLSVIGFIGVILGLVSSYVLSWFGFKRLLIVALVLGAFLSLYQSTFPSFWLFVSSRILEGLSHLIIVVAAPTLIAQISPERHRGFAMTLWSTFFGVTFALVAWFGVPMAQIYGLESLFYLHAICQLIIAFALMMHLPNTFQDSRQSAGLDFKKLLNEHWLTYRSPYISAPSLGWLCYTLTFVAMMTILPDLLNQDERAIVTAIMSLSGMIVAMLCGAFMLPHVKAVHLVIAGFLSSAMIMPLFWVLDIAIFCIILFSLLGFVQGASFAAITELNSNAIDQARANGAMAQMGNLGNLAGTPILLTLMVTFGTKGLIFGIVTCFLGGAIVHIYLQHRRKFKS